MMDKYLPLINSLVNFTNFSNHVDDKWGYINISGTYFEDFITQVLNLKHQLSNLGFDNILKIDIDNSQIGHEDLEDYKETKVRFSSWLLKINKLPLINIALNGVNFNYFLTSKSCEDWIASINPLLDTCPFNTYHTLKIIIADIKHPFGGEHVYFLPADNTYADIIYKAKAKLPSPEEVQENIHVISAEKITVNCNAYHLTNGVYTTTLGELFISQACTVLAASVINEYYSVDKIVIDGIKRLPLKLGKVNNQSNIVFYQRLLDLVKWVYEDRVSIRKKLFHERLSLDLDSNQSFLEALELHLPNALSQAMERYNFVIIDRKDAYVKELKELLKDIKSQSDLYSVKIRTLLSNFSRDLLAAILLIGFTVFTKFSENLNLQKSKLLEYVFYALGVYYLFSILMQMIVDVTDIRVSKKEILYWKNTTKELIPEKEFTKHINDSLRGRRISLYWLYPLIVICYLAISYMCFKYPHVFRTLLASGG